MMKKAILFAIVMIFALVSKAETIKIDSIVLNSKQNYKVEVINITLDIVNDTAFVSYTLSVSKPVYGTNEFGMNYIAGYSESTIYVVENAKFLVKKNIEDLFVYHFNNGLLEYVSVSKTIAFSFELLCGYDLIKCSHYNFN